MKRKIKTPDDLELDERKTRRAERRQKNAHKKNESAKKNSKRASVVVAAAIGLSFLTTTVPAQALTIRNGDAQTHTVLVVEDGVGSEYLLQPTQVATDLCTSFCEVFVAEDPASYEAVAGEVATITRGLLVFEDPALVKASVAGSRH